MFDVGLQDHRFTVFRNRSFREPVKICMIAERKGTHKLNRFKGLNIDAPVILRCTDVWVSISYDVQINLTEFDKSISFSFTVSINLWKFYSKSIIVYDILFM